VFARALTTTTTRVLLGFMLGFYCLSG